MSAKAVALLMLHQVVLAVESLVDRIENQTWIKLLDKYGLFWTLK